VTLESFFLAAGAVCVLWPLIAHVLSGRSSTPIKLTDREKAFASRLAVRAARRDALANQRRVTRDALARLDAEHARLQRQDSPTDRFE
jgi:hypothetical protein